MLTSGSPVLADSHPCVCTDPNIWLWPTLLGQYFAGIVAQQVKTCSAGSEMKSTSSSLTAEQCTEKQRSTAVAKLNVNKMLVYSGSHIDAQSKACWTPSCSTSDDVSSEGMTLGKTIPSNQEEQNCSRCFRKDKFFTRNVWVSTVERVTLADLCVHLQMFESSFQYFFHALLPHGLFMTTFWLGHPHRKVWRWIYRGWKEEKPSLPFSSNVFFSLFCGWLLLLLHVSYQNIS